MPKTARFYRITHRGASRGAVSEEKRKRAAIRLAQRYCAVEGGRADVEVVWPNEGAHGTSHRTLIFQCHALEDRPKTPSGNYRVVVDEL